MAGSSLKISYIIVEPGSSGRFSFVKFCFGDLYYSAERWQEKQ